MFWDIAVFLAVLTLDREEPHAVCIGKLVESPPLGDGYTALIQCQPSMARHGGDDSSTNPEDVHGRMASTSGDGD